MISFDSKCPTCGRAYPKRTGISPRERDVLRELIRPNRGHTNEHIALRLGLSHQTVKTYVSQLCAKLGCADRVELALMAERSGQFKEELQCKDAA